MCSLDTLRGLESSAGEEEGVEESKCTLPSEEQRSSSAREGAPNINGRYICALVPIYLYTSICMYIYVYIYNIYIY